MTNEVKPPQTTADVVFDIAYFLVPLLFLFFILSFISTNINITVEDFLFSVMESIFYVIFIAIFILIISTIFFLYYNYKLSLLLNEEHAKAEKEQLEVENYFKNERWQRILDHTGSDHPNDWKIAIMESDMILEEMLEKMGYVGDTIADKLKQVEKCDFKTLDNAWKAHKTRNRIAHDSGFVLNKRKTAEVIKMYQSVFEEFQFI